VTSPSSGHEGGKKEVATPLLGPKQMAADRGKRGKKAAQAAPPELSPAGKKNSEIISTPEKK